MDERWWHLAACSDEAVDAELFHPEPGQSNELALALGVCRRCPVERACLDAAVREEAARGCETYGVRGGMSAPDREPLVKARRRKVRQQESAVTQRIVQLAGHGMAVQDIARVLGMKPDAVSARKKRAKVVQAAPAQAAAAGGGA